MPCQRAGLPACIHGRARGLIGGVPQLTSCAVCDGRPPRSAAPRSWTGHRQSATPASVRRHLRPAAWEATCHARPAVGAPGTRARGIGRATRATARQHGKAAERGQPGRGVEQVRQRARESILSTAPPPRTAVPSVVYIQAQDAAWRETTGQAGHGPFRPPCQRRRQTAPPLCLPNIVSPLYVHAPLSFLVVRFEGWPRAFAAIWATAR